MPSVCQTAQNLEHTYLKHAPKGILEKINHAIQTYHGRNNVPRHIAERR